MLRVMSCNDFLTFNNFLYRSWCDDWGKLFCNTFHNMTDSDYLCSPHRLNSTSCLDYTLDTRYTAIIIHLSKQFNISTFTVSRGSCGEPCVQLIAPHMVSGLVSQDTQDIAAVWTNQRPVFRSRDLSRPIRAHSGKLPGESGQIFLTR